MNETHTQIIERLQKLTAAVEKLPKWVDIVNVNTNTMAIRISTNDFHRLYAGREINVWPARGLQWVEQEGARIESEINYQQRLAMKATLPVVAEAACEEPAE